MCMEQMEPGREFCPRCKVLLFKKASTLQGFSTVCLRYDIKWKMRGSWQESRESLAVESTHWIHPQTYGSNLCLTNQVSGSARIGFQIRSGFRIFHTALVNACASSVTFPLITSAETRNSLLTAIISYLIFVSLFAFPSGMTRAAEMTIKHAVVKRNNHNRSCFKACVF